MTKAQLPKVAPAGAQVWETPVRQDLKSGSFPGAKKGDVVQMESGPCRVLAASAVFERRDPELGGLGKRQTVFVVPLTAEEAGAHQSGVQRDREIEQLKSRAKPYDDYNLGGYQTEAQRVEAERRLKELQGGK